MTPLPDPSSATGKGEKTDAIHAMLAEYGALRAESLAAISNRLTVMTFTFGTLSVVIAGLLTRRIADGAAGAIGLLFVPQMAKAGLLIWLGEYNRSQRAGNWLAGLEDRLNVSLGSTDLMGWERSLSKRAEHMSFPYQACVVFILGVGYAGAFLGVYFLAATVDKHFSVWFVVATVAILAVYAIAIEILFLRFFLTKWREIRRQRP